MEKENLSRRGFLVRSTLFGSAAAAGAMGLLRPGLAFADGNGALSFTDDFQRADSTTVGNGWNPIKGSWAIVSDSLELTAGTSQLLIAQTGFELGKTFVVEGKVRLSAPGGSHNGIAFNLHHNTDGSLSWYGATLMLGNPSIWSVWEVGTGMLTRLPAFDEIDISADHTYTIRVTSAVYGWFEVQILDGSQVLASKLVQLDPFTAQLAGGYAGMYSQSGVADGLFRVTKASVASTSVKSNPPAPPAPAPLVCTPVQGPPYTVPGSTYSVVSSSQVDLTQSRVGVVQPVLTHNDIQYVGYYDANLQLVIASRAVGSDTWVKQPLPEYIGWDAHNGITMAVDRDNQLHVAADMHNVPLIYFRTKTAGDVTTLTKIDSMVDPSTENSMTYPVFLYNGDGALIYNYRNGGSGNGSSYYNIYDESTQTWSRLFDQPLFNGQGLYNSYPSNPALGPDGNFHMVWVWRDTADAATNSHLCYARSKDMVSWVTVGGDPISLPIVYSTRGVIVDPVPNYGGLLNGAPKIGFDADNNVLISYYKLDRELNTQVYVAAPESKSNAWKTTQVSQWTGRYLAQGIGAIPNVPTVSPVSTLPDGNLQMQYNYLDQSGIWIMNPKTLIPFTEAAVPASMPSDITALRSTFPGMQVQVRGDLGAAASTDEKYVLRWEALPTNMDRPRNPPYPDPSPLQVYLLKASS